MDKYVPDRHLSDSNHLILSPKTKDLPYPAGVPTKLEVEVIFITGNGSGFN